MVSGLSPLSSVPVMNYKPDPGEPAVRLSAPQNQSALLVTAQEQRNETRLRHQAMMHGEDILYSKKTFDIGVGQSSPVYNAGLTTVVTKLDKNGFLPDSNPVQTAQTAQTAKQQESNKNERNQEFQNPFQSLQQINQPTKEQLEQQEQDIQSEDKRLSRTMFRTQLEKEQAFSQGNLIQYQTAKRKEDQLNQKMEDLDKLEQKNERNKMETKQHEIRTAPSETSPPQQQPALGPVDILFGLTR